MSFAVKQVAQMLNEIINYLSGIIGDDLEGDNSTIEFARGTCDLVSGFDEGIICSKRQNRIARENNQTKMERLRELSRRTVRK